MKHKYLIISLFSIFGFFVLWIMGIIRCVKGLFGKAEGAWKQWASLLGHMFLAGISGFFIAMPFLGSLVGLLFLHAPQPVQSVAGFAAFYLAGVIAANILAQWFKKQEKQED